MEKILSGEQIVFELQIFFREVPAVLRFGARAVRKICDGKNRRRLNSFGDAHALELFPPTLQIVNELFRRREIFFDETNFAAEIFFKFAVRVPIQNFFGR